MSIKKERSLIWKSKKNQKKKDHGVWVKYKNMLVIVIKKAKKQQKIKSILKNVNNSRKLDRT